MGFFKTLLNGVLDRFRNAWDREVLDAIKTAIHTTIKKLLFNALQIDNEPICIQLKAEQLGEL